MEKHWFVLILTEPKVLKFHSPSKSLLGFRQTAPSNLNTFASQDFSVMHPFLPFFFISFLTLYHSSLIWAYTPQYFALVSSSQGHSWCASESRKVKSFITVFLRLVWFLLLLLASLSLNFHNSEHLCHAVKIGAYLYFCPHSRVTLFPLQLVVSPLASWQGTYLIKSTRCDK